MAQLKDTIVLGDLRVTDALSTDTLKPRIIEGGQMVAPLSWTNTGLPEKDSTAEFFLAIDSFANGGKTYWVSKANVITALGIHTYLPLAGGTMTGALNFANNTWNKIGDDAQMGDVNSAGTLAIQGLNGNTRLLFTTYNQTNKLSGGSLTWDGSKFITSHIITRDGVASSWHKGRDNALIAITSIPGYSPVISTKTSNGSWEIGSYTDSTYTDDLLFSYVKDTTYNGKTAKTDAQIRFYESGGALFAGQTAIVYNPNATDSTAKGMLNLTSNAPENVVKSGTYSWGINHLVPNLASGGHTCLITGRSSGTNNSAALEFNYVGSNHADNSVGLGLYGNNQLLTINKAGTVKIKAGTASASSATGALVVGGGIGTGAASYLTGSVHIIGSAGGNALIVRGISGCDSSGNRGDTADSQALYLNLNGGFIQLGKTINDADNYVAISYTQAASSTSTGALRVSGGVGISGALYTGGDITASGKTITAGTLKGNLAISYLTGGPLSVALGGTGVSAFPAANAVLVSGNSTTASVTTRGIYTLTAAGNAGWDTAANRTKIPDMSFIAYWNGAYNNAGTSNITNVGTISKGTWQGTSVKVAYGGTGTTTAPTKGGIIYGSSASAYACTAAGTSGQVLMSQGTSAPKWETLNIPDGVTIYTHSPSATHESRWSSGSAYLTGTATAPTGAPQTGSSLRASSLIKIDTTGTLTLNKVTFSAASAAGTSGVTSSIYMDYSDGINKLILGTTSVYVNRSNNVLRGAAWNDYAECRQSQETEFGRCVEEHDDGILTRTEQRLIPAACITSDTYGFIQGETPLAKMPIAVAGRVLAYPYRNRDEYHAGMAVCSAPNGTVDIMTREEILQYPDCIIGYVSEIPQYAIWGETNIEVNGRIWVKVK